MFGESTCAANLVAYPYPLGDALFDVAALSRVAAERCATARCAINTMGTPAPFFACLLLALCSLFKP